MEYTLANNCIKDYNHYLLVNQLMVSVTCIQQASAAHANTICSPAIYY